MNQIKRLPDAEFEIMRIIWQYEPPMSANQIISYLGSDNTWKPQTVFTLLVRLIEKGFISSEKSGKNRFFSPLILREEYLNAETGNFYDKFHGSSIRSLISSLYDGKKLSEEEIEDLKHWLEERK